MPPPNQLPPPTPDELALNAALTHHIRAEMLASGGAIPFRRFMELALYAPGLGYYMNGARKLGRDGDFITAPEISPLFGRCVAKQCAQVLSACADPVILEAGAGTGQLAADVLRELERMQALPARYWILELSAELRQRQHATLLACVPHLIGRVEWLDQLPRAAFSGVILANELIDALPVHAVRVDRDGMVERYVAWTDRRFEWRDGEFSSSRLRERGDALLRRLTPGYQTEINLSAEAWLETLAPLLDKGAILLIDYGFPAHEYYHPDRAAGTLMCHYRHHAHPDPLILAGLQDITAHVDFSALAHCAHDAGMRIAGFTTQAYFLLALGLGEMAADHHGDQARWTTSQQVQILTSPAEMGELFKVLAMTKHLDLTLDGFTLIDHRHRL